MQLIELGMYSNNKSATANAYMRFLQLARAVQQLPDAPQLDANEKALLEELCCVGMKTVS